MPPGVWTSNLVTLTRRSRRLGLRFTVSGGSFRGGANGADTRRLIRRLPGPRSTSEGHCTESAASTLHHAPAPWTVRPAAVHTTPRRPSLTRPVSLRAAATGPGFLAAWFPWGPPELEAEPPQLVGHSRSSPVYGMGTQDSSATQRGGEDHSVQAGMGLSEPRRPQALHLHAGA